MSKKPTIYWDACIFYELLGNEDVDSKKKNAIQEILNTNDKEENYIITSVITHLEVLPAKLDEKGANDEEEYLALFDAKKFGEVEINTNIILLAREIRNFYYAPPDADGKNVKIMDLGDSIHLATAIIHKVDEFHTRDNSAKK